MFVPDLEALADLVEEFRENLESVLLHAAILAGQLPQHLFELLDSALLGDETTAHVLELQEFS